MENREQQILSEIKSMMASIRSQLEILDAKMAELQQTVDPQEIDMVPIDLDLADVSEDDIAQEVVVVSDDLPFDDVPEVAEESVSVSEPEPVHEPLQETEDDLPEALPASEEEDDDDLPIFAEPEMPVHNVQKPKASVIDAMTDRQAWRTDMPGTPVKDIRSAISLNDRIFFINYLFNEDPMAFQETLTKINMMGSVDEVVDYVTSHFPEWNMDSEVVYRFMMAVRRRIR